ncbi:FtsQ-type POTRA domain-containing protein [Leifsonia sp. NPDC058248]|uniref:FtsQ-type POTRA domain-containing protein n=1 Tax=Leifsonia sp. NPDC058248 TaxID=3346402 RepID=UPI0036DB6C89
MKRPQGFDQPPPAAPATQAAPAPAARGRASRDTAAAGGNRVEATTAPIPVQIIEGGTASAMASTAATAPGSTAPTKRTDAQPRAEHHGVYDRLPSNREISRSLREARKERFRVERGEVRRFTKRSRRRRMMWLAGLGTLAALVLGVTLTAFSPLMALRTIDVTGTSRIDVAAVKKSLGDQLGRPLPLVDQGAIRSDLAAFPLIRSYSVESHPPNAIVVRIVERQPIGVLRSGTAFTLVDAAKVTIASSPARPAGYPLIAASGAPAEEDAGSGFAAAASVLASLPDSLFARVDTVSATTTDDVSFTLRGTGAKVVWGSGDDSDLKAAALAALLKSAGGARVFNVSSPHSVTTG